MAQGGNARVLGDEVLLETFQELNASVQPLGLISLDGLRSWTRNTLSKSGKGRLASAWLPTISGAYSGPKKPGVKVAGLVASSARCSQSRAAPPPSRRVLSTTTPQGAGIESLPQADSRSAGSRRRRL